MPRALRRNSTDAEHLLWRHMRNRNVDGAKFRRQQALGPYVLDFYSHEHSLVIEVDGSRHFEAKQQAHDAARTAWLEAAGLRVLRFDNRQVLTETTAVLETILDALSDRGPLPGGEGIVPR